jgi:hypothetical protein
MATNIASRKHAPATPISVIAGIGSRCGVDGAETLLWVSSTAVVGTGEGYVVGVTTGLAISRVGTTEEGDNGARWLETEWDKTLELDTSKDLTR